MVAVTQKTRRAGRHRAGSDRHDRRAAASARRRSVSRRSQCLSRVAGDVRAGHRDDAARTAGQSRSYTLLLTSSHALVRVEDRELPRCRDVPDDEGVAADPPKPFALLQVGELRALGAGEAELACGVRRLRWSPAGR